MKISTRSRYGLRLMVYLSVHYEKGSVFLKDIAKKEAISEKYLGQIIIPLKNSGLVNSIRGAHGGYILSRKPELITLREVVEVLEGGLDLVECVERKHSCKRSHNCITQQVWRDLSVAMKSELNKTTLGDLAAKYNKQDGRPGEMYSI
jgi:Rrf2 family protein